MSKLLDKEFYVIRTELCKRLFPKGEDAYPLHEILVMDKVMSLIAWENRGLDVFEYYYKERVIFPDGGIYFFGRKYYIDEDRLIEILITVIDRFNLIMDEIPDIKSILNGPEEDLHEQYRTSSIQVKSVKLKDFSFVDGFILYNGYVCPNPSAKRDYTYISINEKKKVDILLGHNGQFDFFKEQDKKDLLKLYKLAGASKVIVDVKDVAFEDGAVSFNPIPSQRIFIKTRIKLLYSKAIYNQYKEKATLRNFTVAVSGGRVIAFGNRSVIDCIKTIKKEVHANKYVKALLKVDSLTSIFNDTEIDYVFEGDPTMTKSIKRFRTALGQKVKQKKHDLSEAMKAIKQETSSCRGSIDCMAFCSEELCKYDTCFKLMLSHSPKYPVLLVDELYAYEYRHEYMKNMILTVQHPTNPDQLNIVVKSINQPHRKSLLFTVSRFNYYKSLFIIYTYLNSELPNKRMKANYMKYFKPFGILTVNKNRY